jgi:dipeptidyl aminopeptidase/acylaminoacyl peptidase
MGDLRHGYELDLGRGAVRGLLDGPPTEQPARYASASPASLLPLGVPQLLFHGTADNLVPLDCSAQYAEAAARAGDPIQVLPVEGARHNLTNPDAPPWPGALAELKKLVD